MPSLTEPGRCHNDDSRAILQSPDNAGLPVAGLDLCLLDVEAHDQVIAVVTIHVSEPASAVTDGAVAACWSPADPKQRDSTSSAQASVPGLPRIATAGRHGCGVLNPVGFAARADVELDLQLSHTADLEQDVVEVVVTFVGKVLEADLDVIAAIGRCH
jgi:hypothetical protein